MTEFTILPMTAGVIESSYPIGFRETEARELGRQIKNRHSVVLVGMKRVGISNFLRFFLNHKGIAKEYIQDNQKHLLITVDLHDLVERELSPFWILTFKRIVDSVYRDLADEKLKKHIDTLFLDSIQANNLFLTIDNIRQALVLLVDRGILPTIFFIRFDRISESANPDFISNIMGLVDSTSQRLSYVFTSFRNLHELSPQMFPRASISSFAHDMYLKPAAKEDIVTIYNTYRHKFRIGLGKGLEKDLFELVDGYIQYLQLSLIILHENKKIVEGAEELKNLLLSDERIVLQSEELWESLSEGEKKVLLSVVQNKHIGDKQKKDGKYLWDTGIINIHNKIFSKLFLDFVEGKEKEARDSSGELSKKEHTLFDLLQKNAEQICEREHIVQQVWPEAEAFGVSDWAIDRLAARLRNKLKLQKSEFEIQTIKTRGYKLIKA